MSEIISILFSLSIVGLYVKQFDHHLSKYLRIQKEDFNYEYNLHFCGRALTFLLNYEITPSDETKKQELIDEALGSNFSFDGAYCTFSPNGQPLVEIYRPRKNQSSEQETLHYLYRVLPKSHKDEL